MDADPTGRSKRILFILGGIMLGLVAALFFAELTLRFLIGVEVLGNDIGFVRFVNEIHSEPVSHSIYRRSADPVLGVEFIPGSERRHVRINSGGFRGKEYGHRADPGVHRIVVLGDSETFGALLREDETFPASLETVLNERAGNAEHEVLNFGFPGYGTMQEMHLLRTQAVQYNPDTIVLYFVFNDPIPETQTRLVESSPLQRSHVSLLFRYGLAVNQPSRYQRLHRRRGIVEFYKELIPSAEFDACKDTIRRMGSYLAEREIRFIVVIAPEVLGFDSFEEYPYDEIHASVRGIASPQIEIVDPLRRVAALGDDPTALWVTPTDCHKSFRANRAVAEVVAEQVLKKP